jgi:hypothetical protein
MLEFVNRYLILMSAFVPSLVGILLYMCVLQAANPPAIIFHSLFILSTSSAALIAISPESPIKAKVFVAVSWILTLLLVNSNALVLPTGVLSNESDTMYLKQVVDSILTSGHNAFGAATGNAFEYSFYPISQVFTAILVLVTHADSVWLMKLLPSALYLVVLLVLFCFYRNFLSSNDSFLGAFITGSCFFSMYSFSQLVQQTFGTVFALLVLLSLTRKSASSRLVFAISLVALASSHLLSGLYLLFVLGVAKAYMSIRGNPRDRDTKIALSASSVALVGAVVLAWLAYAALFFIPNIASELIGFPMINASPHLPLAAGIEDASNPLAIRVIGDIGIVLFALMLTLGFVFLNFRARELPLADLLPYAFGSAVLFVANVAIFSFGLTSINDILARSFWWVSMIATPFAAFALSHKWRGPRLFASPDLQLKNNETRKRKFEVRPILACLTIILILLSSMYYHYPASRYDNSQPADTAGFVTLYRLPLVQWVSVGVWSSTHLTDSPLYGDKVAWVYVGALATKSVNQFPTNSTLQRWFQSSDLGGSMLVLRMSLPDEPHYGLLVDSSQLISTMQKSNVIYGSGEVVIAIVLG